MANRPPVVPLWPKRRPENLQESKGAFPMREAVDLDPQAIDDLLRGHGLVFVHHKAMKCPVGVVDVDDERHPHGDHGSCQNGFLYKAVAPMTCAPNSNNDSASVQDIGVLSQATMQVTAPRFYDVCAADGSPLEVHLAPYDKLYLAEESITVPNWQLFEACGGPTDKMDYPLALVEYLVDAQGQDLAEGKDFCIQAGLLKWLPGGRHVPVPNVDAGTGAIMSIRYRYRPWWIISNLPHEIRVSQGTNPLTGERYTQVLQQQAHLQREYIFNNQPNDPEAKDVQPKEVAKNKQPLAEALGKSSLRQNMAARDGGFGPR